MKHSKVLYNFLSVKVFLFLSEKRLCPPQWRNFTGFCFFFKKALVAGKSEGETLCQQQNGSHLVDIHSKDENNFVAGLLNEMNGVRRRLAYLGIERVDESLKWDRDSMNVTYSNWATRQPRGMERCGVIAHDGWWYTTPCEYSTTFPIIICKKGKWFS